MLGTANRNTDRMAPTGVDHSTKSVETVNGVDDTFRTLADNAHDGILISTDGGRYVYANRRAARVTGYTVSELLGKTIEDIAHPDEVAALRDRYGRRQRGERVPAQFETRLVRKDGTEVFIETTGSSMRWHGGPADLIVFRNITRRKRLEEKVQRYTEHLEEEVRRRTRDVVQGEKMAALGILVSGVAHEIKNPLAFLRSNSEDILEDVGTLRDQLAEGAPLDQALLTEIDGLTRTNLGGLERITEITRTLKRFARPDQGTVGMADINQGLRDTLVMVNTHVKHRITFTTDFGGLPELTCNIALLNQVFMNLILNATEAMEKGTIDIRTWCRSGYVYVRIRDDGPGIPVENLKHIFDPFFSTKDEGTGLGLSISYRIVKEQSGSITVKSEVGKGTAFTIRLPITGKDRERPDTPAHDESISTQDRK